jgi:ribosomal protein S18 acetylase RimI-like enzyme
VITAPVRTLIQKTQGHRFRCHLVARRELAKIKLIAKADTDAIGFLPTASLAYYAAMAGIIGYTCDGELRGFLVAAWATVERPTNSHIMQVAVMEEHRREGIGACLVAQACIEARRRQANKIECWVADDLAANDFWKGIGFQKDDERWGGGRRLRGQNHYSLELF